MYSILDESNNEKSTNKDHNAYDHKDLRHTMRGVKPKNHNLGTYQTNKIFLSCFDDKWKMELIH